LGFPLSPHPCKPLPWSQPKAKVAIVGASNNDLELRVKMARTLDEAWQTRDVVVEDSF